mmetsp:Transcript_28380/g.28679  ORF Transcript_28380/g.28679 Transcript_28380/m.28679 type:complete len:107 (+) Transcript_28380:91-411(+)
MQADDEKLRILGANTGLDFIEIRNKYLNKVSPSSISTTQPNDNSTRSNAVENNALDNYQICKRCLGMGIIQEKYNHMLLQKDCPECDGEAVVMRAAIMEKAQSDNP